MIRVGSAQVKEEPVVNLSPSLCSIPNPIWTAVLRILWLLNLWIIVYVSLVIALRFPEEFSWRVHQRSWSFSWTVFCLTEARTQQLLICHLHLLSHCPEGNMAKYNLLLMTSNQSFVTKVTHRLVVTTSHTLIGTANGTYSMMQASQPFHLIWWVVQSAPSKHTCMCLKSWAVSNQDSNLFSSSHARGSSWYSHS